ncbi:N-acetyltransferase [Vibrio alfacsensis]|uniref:N-acetyltransferase n=1 Tax=Vibrio alfacsensis TaxID=1074311 RepID=A0ABN5PIQ9_9VIBR|nr:N-acetyltransferase [Vibrio alfacsensis]AXY03107.1 N-acetyltransferase [Vibrio alfacsensis]
MKISCAEKTDLDAVYQLEHQLFGDHSYPQFFIRQAYDCWSRGLMVAKQAQDVAGYVLLTPSLEQHAYWILSLAVATKYRGQGIARLLVEDAISQVEVGSSVKLTVDPNNAPAYQLYCSMGFSVIEEEDNYFGDGEPRLVMQLTR